MLSEVHREYWELLPFAPKDMVGRVNALIAPIDIFEVEKRGFTARDAADIWKAALDNIGNKDSFAWVFVLLAVRKTLNFNHPLKRSFALELGRRTTLGGRPMSVSGTWFEATRRLAANLFHIGRTGTPGEQNQRVLREAIALLDLLIAKDVATKTPKTGRMYFGMRGVARVLLARTAEDKHVAYSAACEDLDRSRLLGNDGVEASYYLIETRVHLFDLDFEEKHLSEAERVLTEVDCDRAGSRLLWFSSGGVALKRGFAAAAVGDHSAALAFFRSALTSFRNADSCAPDERLASEFLSMSRGLAAFKVLTSQHELEQPDDLALLDAAIADLQAGSESLPAALLIRSRLRRKERRYPEAAEDLQRALDAVSGCEFEDSAHAESNRLQCLAGLSECAIQLGVEREDVAAVLDGCMQFLRLPSDSREASVGSAAYGARFLLERGASEHRDVVRRIAYSLRSRIVSLNLVGEQHRFIASHAAGILLRISRNPASEPSLRAAYELSNSAVKQGEDALPELHWQAGEAALQLGKTLLRRGKTDEATDLFEDAGVNFEAAVRVAEAKGTSDSFSLQVAHSKAGEAYVRAHAFSGFEEHAKKATFHLTRSRELGNSAPELVGLLGDVAYRHGRRNSDANELRLALALKEDAKLKGNNSRENRSVSAAAALALWRVEGEASCLTTAIGTAIEAAEIDPTWPWPFFQLAEMAALRPDLRRNETESLLMQALRPDLVRMVRSGQAQELARIGVKLAVENQEFAKAEFGSRQPVYVLDDPHGLLKQTIVFKETTTEAAVREKETVERFSEYLGRVGAPSSFKLPEPMFILPHEGKVVYVMKRARGSQLGKAALSSAGRAETLQAYDRAVRFLAYYHAWKLGKSPLVQFTWRMNSQLVRNALRFWRLAGFGVGTVPSLFDQLLAVIPHDFPAIPKKDAHPENWLVDESGNVVMLDLESVGRCPLLFELVQLLDDYPLLPVDHNGWRERIAHCNVYLNQLAGAGIELHQYGTAVPDAYAAFVLLRCAFGLARNRARRGRVPSAAVRAGDARETHYLAMLEYLARAELKTVRSAAEAIRNSVLTANLARV